jgi:hypothetical protein
MDPKNVLGAQFVRTAEDMNNLASVFVPGLPTFARHLLQAQKEILQGITSLVDAQIANLDAFATPTHPAASAGPERIRVVPEPPTTL